MLGPGLSSQGSSLESSFRSLIWITPVPKLLPCWDIQFYSLVRCTLILPQVSGFDVQLHSWCLLESQTCHALDTHPPHESCPFPSLVSQTRALPLNVSSHKRFFLSYSHLILEHGPPPNTSWIPLPKEYKLADLPTDCAHFECITLSLNKLINYDVPSQGLEARNLFFFNLAFWLCFVCFAISVLEDKHRTFLVPTKGSVWFLPWKSALEIGVRDLPCYFSFCCVEILFILTKLILLHCVFKTLFKIRI